MFHNLNIWEDENICCLAKKTDTEQMKNKDHDEYELKNITFHNL